MDPLLSYREEWTIAQVAFGLGVYLLFMGVMLGTSIRDEMPRFLLVFGVALLTVQCAFFLLHRRTVDVDVGARRATVSLRWFGLNLAPKVHDLSAAERVVLSKSTTRGVDATRPMSRQSAPSDFASAYYVTLHGREGLELVVFASKSEAEAHERAGLWSQALRIPLGSATEAGPEPR